MYNFVMLNKIDTFIFLILIFTKLKDILLTIVKYLNIRKI